MTQKHRRSLKKCLRKMEENWCELSLWMKKLEQDWEFMTLNDLGAEMGEETILRIYLFCCFIYNFHLRYFG